MIQRPELTAFVVIGPRGAEFPLDMLRWGACWPYDGQAVDVIHRSLVPGLMGTGLHTKPELKLQMVKDDLKLFEISKRFSSFGWTVMNFPREEDDAA